MSDRSPTRPSDCFYRQEQLSPDGQWRIVYDYLDGEKTPLVVSPRVTKVRTGLVIVDLWRSGMDGAVSDFSPTGFKITLRDPYGPTVFLVQVDGVSEQFVVDGDASGPRALADLPAVLWAKMEAARRALRAQLPPPLPQRPKTFWSWLTH